MFITRGILIAHIPQFTFAIFANITSILLIEQIIKEELLITSPK
jgi:hypothetical protein